MSSITRFAICSATSRGYTLISLLVAMALSAIVLTALGSVIGETLRVHEQVETKNALLHQARFAMEQMVHAISHSQRLLLPLEDSASTSWPDNIRDETVPPSPPPQGSSLATAVLAVTIEPTRDIDGNGIPDADNDGDGRIDEDLPEDVTNDSAPGIYLIDDMGDGTVDNLISCCYMDDDEDAGISNEDPINGIDDDGDGLLDEDPGSDMNGDGCPGTCGIDENSDGLIDDGNSADDDEDGQSDEDWYDPVVFYLDGDTLIQRTAVPWDESNNGFINGRDFIAQPIAEYVTRFRVERVAQDGNRSQLVDILLELTSPATRETVSLNTRVRVGSTL
jgi:type II secretory pathway pseudopilin PulG